MYPLRFFYGSEVGTLTKKMLNNLSYFETHYATKVPITSETGIDGVLIDFNDGLRLQIPKGQWHVNISDFKSEFVFVDEDVLDGATFISIEKFFVNWQIILAFEGEIVFFHQFDPHNQKVHFNFPSSAIGDNIILLTYMNAFKKTFDCQITCTVPKHMKEIVENYYPDVEIRDEIAEDTYATFYMIGQNFNEPITSTENLRTLPLLKFGHAILGWNIEPTERVIYKPTQSRMINEPYVCIAVQASGTPKGWLNPNGWNEVVNYLKSLGYRVLCIDKMNEQSNFEHVIKMPEGAEDFTGDVTLMERINMIAYADFFIGVSSGLAWIAWSTGTEVIMISGITKPHHEFETPYRIYNNLVCNGCFHDMKYNYKEVFECPKFKGTEQVYECSKKISAQQVINAIDKLIERKKSNES